MEIVARADRQVVTDGLVRIRHKESGACFHVRFDADGNVEVLCVGGYEILDVENKVCPTCGK